MAESKYIIASLPETYDQVLLLPINQHWQFWFFHRDQGFLGAMAPCPLDDLADISVTAQLILMLPGHLITQHQITLPEKYQAKALPAIVKYALEEALAEEVEQMHFAIALEKKVDNQVPVSIIKGDTLKQYLDLLAKRNLQPDCVLSEFLLLPPATEKNAYAMRRGDYILLRAKTLDGAIHEKHFETCVAALPRQDIMFFDDQVTAQSTSTQAKPYDWQRFSDFLRHDALSYSLLQGVFKPKKRRNKQKRLWWLSIGIGFFALTLLLFQEVWYFQQLNHRVAQQQETIKTLYLKQFPQATQVVAPRARLNRRLKQLSKQAKTSAFSSLLSQFAHAYRLTKATIHLNHLSYRAGVLQAEIEVNYAKVLQKFVANLTSTPVSVTQHNVIEQGNKLKASLRLTEAG